MPSDWSRSLALIFLVYPLAWAGQYQTVSSTNADVLSSVKNLYREEQWEALLQLVPASPNYPAELDYYRGMALARLQRGEEARQSFEMGSKKAPADKRFLLELAGLSFKRQQFSKAKAYLVKALDLDAQDRYAQEFLASLYFLEGNLEAALKYWNGVEKPRIEAIKMEPQPRLRPVLLDRAFAFAPASLLKLSDFYTTQAQLALLEIYPRYRFELLPRQDQTFDLLFHPMERNGWGNSKIEGLFSLLKGVPYQTLHLELFNLKQSAINSSSLLRWDAQKRRVFTSFSGPWRGDPKWRYRLHWDGRKENWDLSRSFQGPTLPAGDLRIQKQTAGAEILSNVNGRWSWKSAVEVSHRKFRNAPLDVAMPDPLFPQGLSLKYQIGFDQKLIRIPERRFTTESFATWEIARTFVTPQTFSKVQGGLRTRWLPQPSGNDYSMMAQFRAGTTTGSSPFDELFILGLERDNDLWMRAHIGTRNGKKGNSLLGRDYLLFNWETDKSVYQYAFFDLKAGPFLDTGKIFDKAKRFGSREWLWDVGAQLKVRILSGPTFIFFYGKDLQSGGNAFYTTISR